MLLKKYKIPWFLSYILATGSDAVLQKPTKDLPGRTMSLTSLACGKWLDCTNDCPLLICCPKKLFAGSQSSCFSHAKIWYAQHQSKNTDICWICNVQNIWTHTSATNRFPTISATLFYQPSLQHFSTGPFCNTPQSTTLLYNPSLRHFSTTLFPTFLCNTPLQHFPQHFSLTCSNTSVRQFFATTPLPQNPRPQNHHQKNTITTKHNTTLTRHSTTPVQRHLLPPQQKHPSSALSDTPTSQRLRFTQLNPLNPLNLSLEPKHPTTLCLESGPNLPSFFPPWPSPGPSSSPPSPRTSHWLSWLRGAPHSSRARPSIFSNPSHRWLDHGPTSGGSPLHRWAKRKNEGFWNPGCVD